jgi:hypothetical protein
MPQGRQGQAAEPTKSARLDQAAGLGSAQVPGWLGGGACGWWSVRFDAGGYSNAHIQGAPAALRELAAALTLAADQADQADATTEAARLPAGVRS